MRCFDCLSDLGNADRFAVLKERTLEPDEALSSDPFAAALAKWHQEIVCADCAGWYRDAIEVPAELY